MSILDNQANQENENFQGVGNGFVIIPADQSDQRRAQYEKVLTEAHDLLAQTNQALGLTHDPVEHARFAKYIDQIKQDIATLESQMSNLNAIEPIPTGYPFLGSVAYQQYQNLLKDLAAIINNPYEVKGLPNPFVGLDSYTYEQQGIYAGRSKTIEAAAKKITSPQTLLFITGESGSGKSSFAQAGLLPNLEKYYTQQYLTTRYAIFRPLEKPLKEVRLAFGRLELHPETWQEGFSNAEQLNRFLMERTPKNQVNLLVLDQFEELFTQSQPEQREVIFQWLAGLPGFEQSRTHLIATLRSDYLPKLFERGQIYDQNRQGVDLRVMKPEELIEAIQRPLIQQYQNQKRLEPELVERLAQDAAQNAAYLPLLQVTLQDLWRRGSLKLSAYNNLTQAIQQRAEEVYTYRDYDGEQQEKRPSVEREQIMQIFLDLVEVSLDNEVSRDVRRRRRRADLESGRPERQRVIEDLRAARLLSISISGANEGSGLAEVDLIHESLIRNWLRLQEAIAHARQNLQQRVRFELALAEWQANGQHESYLLEGVRLAEACELEQCRDIVLNNEEARGFFQTSVALQERKRLAQERTRRRLTRISVGAAAVFLVLALVAFWQWGDANSQRDTANKRSNEAINAQATAEARRIDAENQKKETENQKQQAEANFARSLTTQSEYYYGQNQLDRGLLLSIEATYHKDTVETRATLFEGTLYNLGLSKFLSGHSDVVASVAFSPDGKTLASASADKTIILWDTTTGSQLKQLKGHFSSVLNVAFSPDGKILASASADQSIILWDTTTGSQLKQLKGYDASVQSVAFSPDGKTLASASLDKTIILWDTTTGSQLKQLKGHFSSVFSVAFSPDGKTLVSAGQDQTIILWDTATDSQPKQFNGPAAPVLSVAFSSDGKTLASASADKTIILWNATTGAQLKQLKGHASSVLSVAFSPDGKTLASASADKTIILWDTTGSQLKQLKGHASSVQSVAFSPDSKTLASASADKTIILWDTTMGAQLKQLKGHASPVLSVAFSPDGKTLASASQDQTIILWNPTTGAQLKQLKGHSDYVLNVAFSPDGKTLVSASLDGMIILWNATTGAQLKQLKGHSDAVWSVAFSPDGKTLASASADSSIILWDTNTGAQLKQLKGHASQVQSVAFSPDGKTLASGSDDKTVILWDSTTGTQRTQLKGHSNRVNNVAFSPDGKTLASASLDQTIILWNPTTGGRLKQLKGHSDYVYSLAFSPDGKTLASASADKTIVLWDLDLKSLQNQACKIANHNFTQDEWRQFFGDETYHKTCPDIK